MIKGLIEDRLQATIRADAINGDEFERSVVTLQIEEAIDELRRLREDLVRACNTHDKFVDLSRIILKKPDLEANDQNPIFPCATFREDLRKVLKEATS